MEGLLKSIGVTLTLLAIVIIVGTVAGYTSDAFSGLSKNRVLMIGFLLGAIGTAIYALAPDEKDKAYTRTVS